MYRWKQFSYEPRSFNFKKWQVLLSNKAIPKEVIKMFSLASQITKIALDRIYRAAMWKKLNKSKPVFVHWFLAAWEDIDTIFWYISGIARFANAALLCHKQKVGASLSRIWVVVAEKAEKVGSPVCIVYMRALLLLC